MKRVYRAASLLQVAHARNVLISAGIECELRNVHESNCHENRI